ncbi:MAG: exonuclease domain-containing protein [Lachnospiraceae bacterium]|nr:exonuclease domain-containing protein [Lachnospiraceae bacterium]
MKHVVVDLEMNPLAKEYKSEREICRNEIIQIGAVLLDEDYIEIGTFSTLVKPQFNACIERNIQRLTKIQTEMVQNAPAFEEAIEMFLSWCQSVNDEITVYQWSESDCLQLMRELELKHIRPDLAKGLTSLVFQDLQKEFGDTLGVSRALSLKDAVMYAGEDFSGIAHNALYDARNTAALLRITRVPALRKKLSAVIRAFDHKPMGTAMGDLFDFGKLGLTA